MNHDWTPSRLGHGENMCRRCLITNREAAVLGLLNTCEPAKAPESYLEKPLPEPPEAGEGM